MDTFIGTILLWALNWAPRGWALCDGSALPINQYTALFSLLGTTYGGNGTTNFNLPDLRSRLPLGMGQGPGLTNHIIGSPGGVETTVLGLSQLPMHTHVATFTPSGGGAVSGTLQASAATGNSASPVGNYIANANYPGDPGSGAGPATCMAYVDPAHAGTLGNLAGLAVTGGGGTGTVALATAGNSAPVPIMPPFLTLNYIICLEGLFPSRP